MKEQEDRADHKSDERPRSRNLCEKSCYNPNLILWPVLLQERGGGGGGGGGGWGGGVEVSIVYIGCARV